MTLAFRYRPVPPSPLAWWDVRWKLAAILIAVCGIAALDHLAPAAAALALGLLLLVVARLPRGWVFARLALVAIPTLPFLLVLPLTLEGPGWSIGPVQVSERGIVAGAAVFCRGVAIGCLALVVLGTAPLHHTLAAANRLKLPGLLVQLTLLTYRYAFLLADEFRRLRIAMWTRGYRVHPTRHGYRSLGHATGAPAGSRFRTRRERRRRDALPRLQRHLSHAGRVPHHLRGCSRFWHASGCYDSSDTLGPTLIRNPPAECGMHKLEQISDSNAAPCKFPTPNSELSERRGFPPPNCALRLSSLSHRYSCGRVALADVTFAVDPGECVAIVGPNGAGKTTLFLRLCGVLEGKPGQATVNGLDPAIPEHRKKLPEVVGVVFQNPDDQLLQPHRGGRCRVRTAEYGGHAGRGEDTRGGSTQCGRNGGR